MKKLIAIFLYVQMFTNAFAVSSVVTIALGISLVLFVYGLMKGYHLIKFGEFPYLILFFGILIFDYFFIATGEKKTNHLLMWMVPVLCYFFMFRRQLFILYSLDELKRKVLQIITFSTLTASGFAIIEFLLVNFLGISMSFIPRGFIEEYDPLALVGVIRARSFMEESGHFALFWELFAPLSVYWINKEIKSISIRYSYYIILLVGLIVSFSAFGYVCLVIWTASWLIFKMRKAGSLSNLVSFLVLSAFFFGAIALVASDFYELISTIITQKLDPENGSYSDRESRFEALKYLNGIYVLFGYGPHSVGTLKLEDSYVSFYLGVLMNTGIAGLLCFFLFLLQQFKYVRRIKDQDLRFAFLMSFWFSAMHLLFVDNIYVPWFWVMLSLLGVIHFKEKKRANDDKIIVDAI